MKLYTRTGDQGETSLWGGKRTSKADPRLHAIGTVDELNAMIGLGVAHIDDNSRDIKELLITCQNHLFSLGAELAEARNIEVITTEDIEQLEKEIDRLTDEAPRLKNFVLPGGSIASAHLHVARTVARRAERSLVVLLESEDHQLRSEPVRFLNRLSDLMFSVARVMNIRDGSPEIFWNA